MPQNSKEGSLRPQARFGAQPPHSGGSWRGDRPLPTSSRKVSSYRKSRAFRVTINPRDAAVSLKCARAAGTPDLLFIISYLLFLTRPPPACIQNPFYRTPSAPISPGFVQSGQNAHFTPKNMCNILRKTPLRTGSFFGTIKLCKSAFLQVCPEQNLDVSAKRRGPVRVPRTDCKSL